MKITNDKFIWKIVTHKQAEALWNTGLFELYILFDDDTEKLIESKEELLYAFKKEHVVGLEVGKF